MERRLTQPASHVGELSVVMPAYNEEGNLSRAVGDVEKCIFAVVPDAELLIVNDGSRDRTGEIAEVMATKDPRIRVLHQTNAGHGVALRRGLDAAAGRYLLLLDSDGEIGLSGFAGAWAEAQRGAAVLGFRTDRADGKLRRGVTLGLRLVIRCLFGVRIRDANCPFKILGREQWYAARGWIPEGTLAPSVLLAVYLAKGGSGSFREHPVPHAQRQAGRSMFHLRRLIAFSLTTLFQLARFRTRSRRWAVQRTS